MNSISISQFSFSLIAQVGTINDKKIEKLSKELFDKTDFKNYAKVPMGVVFVSTSGENIAIKENSINYVSLKKDVSKDNLKLTLDTINEVLMLEEENHLTIDVQGVSNTKDSYGETREYFESKISDSMPEDIYGIGYRFLVKNITGNGEIKIEPLVRDSHFYYYEYIMNYNNNINNRDVIDTVFKEVENFESKFKDIKIKNN